ncbi:unnamed protein product [Rhizoctonia solani]|uniref:Mitogen-activated protein kinase n=1 Tax=Rhizoctonia solani TaxID=456999 RepID=A0A8H3C7H2_9AGAM|nr:unnamed protein product [Rhizoctonia solani]
MATTSGNGTPVKDSAKSSPSSKSTSGSRTTVSSGSGGSRGRTLTRNSDPLSAANLEKRGYHTFTTMGRKFHVEKRWKFVRELGQGAYGFVVSAQDQISGETVAIKLVTRLFEKIQLSKRALREISLLRHFANHENITGLIDMDVITPDFNEIYLFMERALTFGANTNEHSADLHQIVRSGQNLSNAHVQYFLYQILRAMKYVHSAGVIHRDLKPGNLLVNADCELKICDFGLSRGFDSAPEDDGAGFMTEYVATRWYRAPEIMLSFRKYTTAIDIWSIGCILGELLGMKPMFKGKDYVDQLNIIIDILGTPDEETLQRIGSVKAQAYIRSLPVKEPKPFKTLFPQADDLALDLLSQMVTFDPAKRLTVLEALKHPYLEAYHDEDDEPECESKYEHWKEIEKLETIDQFRTAIWNEVEEFRREVREMVVESEPQATTNGKATTEKVQDSAVATPVVVESPAAPKESVSEAVDKLPPVEEDTPAGTIPFPSSGRASPSPAGGPVPLPHRPASARTKSSVDPYEVYARRSSILASASPQTMTGNLIPNAEPKDAQSAGGEPQTAASYIVPARSRAASAADSTISAGGISGHGTFPRTILRTLSTLSVNDAGAAGAAAVALGRIKDEQDGVTAADAPPSSIPLEFRPKK